MTNVEKICSKTTRDNPSGMLIVRARNCDRAGFLPSRKDHASINMHRAWIRRDIPLPCYIALELTFLYGLQMINRNATFYNGNHADATFHDFFTRLPEIFLSLRTKRRNFLAVPVQWSRVIPRRLRINSKFLLKRNFINQICASALLQYRSITKNRASRENFISDRHHAPISRRIKLQKLRSGLGWISNILKRVELILLSL